MKHVNLELSNKIATKLKEAALELSAKDEEIKLKVIELSAKDEIVSSLKVKIIELSNNTKALVNELDRYKRKEAIELSNLKEQSVNHLIELYNKIGIKKDHKDFSHFQLAQITELSNALECTVGHKSSVIREIARQQPVASASKEKEHEVSEAAALFGIY